MAKGEAVSRVRGWAFEIESVQTLVGIRPNPVCQSRAPGAATGLDGRDLDQIPLMWNLPLPLRNPIEVILRWAPVLPATHGIVAMGGREGEREGSSPSKNALGWRPRKFHGEV